MNIRTEAVGGRRPDTVAADNTQLGTTVLCLFGVAWTLVLIPLSSASTTVSLAAMGMACLWAGTLLLACRRRDFTAAEAAEAATSELTPAQRQRVFVITNVAQAVVFSVAISICIATARVSWVPLVAAFVVGVHFVPLAWAFGEIAFRWAGAVLAVLGGSGLILVTVNTATPEVAVTITAVGSAITLLATATALLSRHGRRTLEERSHSSGS
ncbi:MAG: hypothetical protein JJT89_04180 [Nitriliruptoraceae bacterium]|nr:hypothetical protein [Nitriliruptoraceae bacterium]